MLSHIRKLLKDESSSRRTQGALSVCCSGQHCFAIIATGQLSVAGSRKGVQILRRPASPLSHWEDDVPQMEETF